jgi:hypothetical protein
VTEAFFGYIAVNLQEISALKVDLIRPKSFSIRKSLNFMAWTEASPAASYRTTHSQ